MPRKPRGRAAIPDLLGSVHRVIVCGADIDLRNFLIITIAVLAALHLLRQNPEWRNHFPNADSEQSNPWIGTQNGQVLPDRQLPPNTGVVTRILPDDTVGARHQKFILRLSSGRTVLVAHNIDIAPRVSGLKEGDIVEFNGVFEANAKGGVIHWTHHDPSGRRPGGWLKHNGTFYK